MRQEALWPRSLVPRPPSRQVHHAVVPPPGTHMSASLACCNIGHSNRTQRTAGCAFALSSAQQVPLAMDCTDSHILICSAPLELLVLQLQPDGSSAAGAPGGPSASEGGLQGAAAPGRPSTAPAGKARLVAVRELSLFNVGRPVQDVALVSVAAAGMAEKFIRGRLGVDMLRAQSASQELWLFLVGTATASSALTWHLLARPGTSITRSGIPLPDGASH